MFNKQNNVFSILILVQNYISFGSLQDSANASDVVQVSLTIKVSRCNRYQGVDACYDICAQTCTYIVHNLLFMFTRLCFLNECKRKLENAVDQYMMKKKTLYIVVFRYGVLNEPLVYCFVTSGNPPVVCYSVHQINRYEFIVRRGSFCSRAIRIVEYFMV